MSGVGDRPSAPDMDAGATGRARTVLVIDDDAAWRSAVKDWLEGDGFRVVGLSRGDWAILAIETHRADVVLLDVQLPGMGGLDVLEFVRLRWPELPVIVTTAFGSADTAHLARRRGATSYLEKPFPMNDLATEVKRVAKPPEQRAG
jgi:two-component system C4-dicarboxylate transport response regulator DctD